MTADRWWRQLLPATVRQATEPIYHYTSPAGLLGLVEHNELWATEAAAMNDVAEVRQGWQFIRDWVARQKGDDQTMGVLELIAEHAGMNEADETPFGYLGTSPEHIYLCCASTRGDDANQWRLYGAEGRGYAVELDPSLNLRAVVSGERTAGQVESYVDDDGIDRSFVWPTDMVEVSPWLHVLYTEQEKSEALAGLVANAVAEFDNVEGLAARSRAGEYERAHEDLLTIIGQDLARLAQLMKSSGFASESEVRVLAVDDLLNGGSSRAAKFRPTAFGIARYVRLSASATFISDDAEPSVDPRATLYDSDKGRQLPIAGVRLGPLIRADNNRSTVKALLESAGHIDLAVKTSDIPLR
ncbi:MAG: DUF2971 domain-containing protein [Propionibacteriaceae bacterium]|nr:DUF2971 domain-containing protein [Propionibacteriaceae bacterium]